MSRLRNRLQRVEQAMTERETGPDLFRAFDLVADQLYAGRVLTQGELAIVRRAEDAIIKKAPRLRAIYRSPESNSSQEKGSLK